MISNIKDKKEYKIRDIQPFNFVIEILNDEQNPVADISFNIYVDGVKISTKTKKGILKVPKPKKEVKLIIT